MTNCDQVWPHVSLFDQSTPVAKKTIKTKHVKPCHGRRSIWWVSHLVTFATTARFLDFFRVHVPFWDYRVEIKSQISPLAVNLAISFIITCPSDQTPLSSTFYFELVSKLTTRGPKRDFISALYFWSFTLYFFRIWIWQNRLPFDYWFTHQRNCWN